MSSIDQPAEAHLPCPSSELFHHELRFLKALELLIETGRVKSVDDLIRYADQDRQVVAANHLRSLKADGLPLDLCYEALRVHIRIIAHKRNHRLMAECHAKRVAVILPLPPHVLEAFLSLAQVTVLVPDGHPVPHYLENRSIETRQGSRAGREAVRSADSIVFEAFGAGHDRYAVDAATADIADPRIIRDDARLIVHLRPHQNPDDVALPTYSQQLNIL